MSAYHVCLLDHEDAVVTSRLEHSLLEAAKTALALVNYAHDNAPDLLDADGDAAVMIRGLGDRELDATEKERVRLFFEEYGASRGDDIDGDEVWHSPGDGGAA